jgi:uncharacterized protein (TIGR02996 family)
MDDHEALVAAIAANPDDDAPRLAFADWLEERGDAARAGFVRDQVLLDRTPPGSDEYRQLHRRTTDTLRANLPAWIQPACDLFGQPASWKPMRRPGRGLAVAIVGEVPRASLVFRHVLDWLAFERGDIGAVGGSFNSKDDAPNLARLLVRHPITTLALRSFHPASWDSAGIGQLNQIRELTWNRLFEDDHALTLFAEWPWTNLRRLALPRPTIEGIDRFCRTPVARRLDGLKMELNAGPIAALARFPLDDRLRHFALLPLEIVSSAATAKAVAALSTMAFRPTLKRLDLAGCRLGDAGLAALARGEIWIRLRTLALDRNRFGDPGWRDFVRGRRTPELRALAASRNFITNDGAARLGDSPLMATLEFLDLRSNRIEGRGAIALARRLVDGPLKKLLLSGNPIADRDRATIRNILWPRVVIEA